MYGFTLDGQGLRDVYHRAIRLMNDLTVPANELAWHMAGKKHGTWKTYERMHKKLEAEDFAEVVSISVGHLELGPEYNYRRRVSEFSVESGIPRKEWEWSWTVYPRKIGMGDEAILTRMLELAAASGGRYGFAYHMSYRWLPNFYPGGLQSGDELVSKEHQDFNGNRGRWGRMWWESGLPLQLRDIFPVSLLTRPYLDLQVGKTTLQSWVNANASRGMLQPLEGNDQITVWRVDPQQIPRVREELFKAGVVFYWRFFEPGDPLERDFSKPFTPPDPIPDIYRADFHAGRNPKFTR